MTQVSYKRLQVSLSRDAYDTFKRLAKLEGRPTASVAREVLESTAEGLAALVGTAERVKGGDVAALADLSAVTFDLLGAALSEGADTIREGSKRRG